jgi:hypothetical protein
MKKNPREKQIAIESGIGCTERGGGSHHLPRVAKEPTTVRVVVLPSRSSTLEAGSKILKKQPTEAQKSWVADLGDKLNDIRVILFYGGQLSLTAHEERLRFFVIEHTQPPALGVQPESPIDTEFSLDLDTHSPLEFHAGTKRIRVRPSPQDQHIAGIAKLEFPKRLAI